MEDHVDPINNEYFFGLHTEIENIENAIGLNLANITILTDRGDPENHDKTDFTKNNTWIDWDLSAIIPIGTKAVIIHVYISSDTVPHAVQFKKKGNTYDRNNAYVISQVAYQAISANILCFCDENRIIQYKADSADITVFEATIKGWF